MLFNIKLLILNLKFHKLKVKNYFNIIISEQTYLEKVNITSNMNNNYFTSDCYKLLELVHDSDSEPLFDNFVDATYVIHLQGNGRYESVIRQLKEYKFTKYMYILSDKGHRKCKKNLYIQNIDKDIIHCNMTVFRHAIQKGYNNILILEDDFIVNKIIRNKDIIEDICSFVKMKEKENETFIYYPGGIPILSIPTDYNFNHYKPYFIAGTHCAIFSNKTMRYILDNYLTYAKSYTLWDLHLSSDNKINKYHYKSPLCYQIFPVTDNQIQWRMVSNPFLNKIIIKIYIFLIHLINIHKEPEPGFTIIYSFSILLFYFIIFVLIILLHKCFNYCKNYKYSDNAVSFKLSKSNDQKQ